MDFVRSESTKWRMTTGLPSPVVTVIGRASISVMRAMKSAQRPTAMRSIMVNMLVLDVFD